MESFVIATKQETEQNQNANDGIDTSYADAKMKEKDLLLSAKVKEMDLLFSITPRGNFSTGFYLHKTTCEPYIVVSFSEKVGEGYAGRYVWMTKVTTSDMDAIVSNKVELDYATAYKLRDVIFERSLMGITFLIDAQRYRYMAYLLVDGVEIAASCAMLSESRFVVPTRCLGGCRYTYDYEQYHVCPGPYEHDYDLPVEFIDKVIIRIEAC